MRRVSELSKIHASFSKVGIIGCGNMVEALLRGIGPLLDPKKYVVASPSLCAGSRVTTHPVAKNNSNAVQGAKLVIYGAKPNDFGNIFAEIAPKIDNDAVVLSMAAGIPINQIQSHFWSQQAVIRIMPNTPVKEKLGVIALSHTSNIPGETIQLITAVLGTVGYVVPLANEGDMDAFTALFGSGPAYFFLILEYLEATADKHNLMTDDKELRRNCFIQLMKGSSVLLENGGLAFDAARRQVTSPNGTTHAAVTSFEKSGLLNVFMDGIDAAASRSKEMGKADTLNVSPISVFKSEKISKQTEEIFVWMKKKNLVLSRRAEFTQNPKCV